MLKPLTTNAKVKLKYRKIELMFQYHVPKNHNETESYSPCVLFLLHPIKVEFHLKSGFPLPPLLLIVFRIV